MEYHVFSRLPIRVSRICFGGWQASDWTTSDPDSFKEQLARALDHGINFIDTAEQYGAGLSESLIGDVIARRRDQVVIATKFAHTNSAPHKLRLALEESLRRLNTDYVDLYQQHWPPKSQPLEETIEVLEQLKAEGKIRALGVCNWMEPEWKEFPHAERIDAVQNCANLVWRSSEPEVFPICRKGGVSVLAYSPLAQGLLTGRFKKRDETPSDSRSRNRLFKLDANPALQSLLASLADKAKQYGKSQAQIALRWLLDHPSINVVISGASSIKQLDENLAVLGWSLEKSDWEELSTLGAKVMPNIGPHQSMWGWHPRA